MKKQLGLPYMGSKRKLSSKILDEIINANPYAKHFYDLLGGGGAISFEALQRSRFETVHYNEINKGVVALLEKIRDDGVTEEFYQWVDRDTFHKHKEDDDWFGGLCQVIWSFGNSQQSYIYGAEVEKDKHIMHTAAATGDTTEVSELFGTDVTTQGDTIQKRAASLKRAARWLARRADLQRLEHLRHLQHLERLEHLRHLQHLERLEHLQITSKSYDEVKIATPPEETIIYLDPPYEGTKEYAHGGFDHRALEKWIAKSPYKIYVSSYNFNLPKVASFRHRSTLSATANNEVTENLYCNQEHIDRTRLF